MPLFTAQALLISPTYTYGAFCPLFGWDNKVTYSNLSSDYAATNFPVTNLSNSNTYEYWKSSSTAEQLVTVGSSLSGTSDYVGIARHNFGSAGITISVEGITADPGAVWEEIFEGFIPANDKHLMLRFQEAYYIGIRIRMIPASTAPYMAILKVGKLTPMLNGLIPGYTPLDESPVIDSYSPISASGEFLGSIINNKSLNSTASFRDIDSDWYYSNFSDLVEGINNGDTFFFAWSPDEFPSQVNHCWLSPSSPARPVINRRTGQKDIDLNMFGTST